VSFGGPCGGVVCVCGKRFNTLLDYYSPLNLLSYHIAVERFVM